MQVEYRVGDLVLATWPYLKELEIEDVSQSAKALKIVNGDWVSAETFHKEVRGKIGRAVYTRNWFGTKRTVIRE